MKISKHIVRVIRSPYYHLTVGILLATTSGLEIIEEWDIWFQGEGNVGAHHGVFLFGITQVLHYWSEMMEGLAVTAKATSAEEM